MHGSEEQANKEQFPTESSILTKTSTKNHFMAGTSQPPQLLLRLSSQRIQMQNTGHPQLYRAVLSSSILARDRTFRGRFSKGIPTFGSLAEQNWHFAANRHLEEALPTPSLPFSPHFPLSSQDPNWSNWYLRHLQVTGIPTLRTQQGTERGFGAVPPSGMGPCVPWEWQSGIHLPLDSALCPARGSCSLHLPAAHFLAKKKP